MRNAQRVPCDGRPRGNRRGNLAGSLRQRPICNPIDSAENQHQQNRYAQVDELQGFSGIGQDVAHFDKTHWDDSTVPLFQRRVLDCAYGLSLRDSGRGAAAERLLRHRGSGPDFGSQEPPAYAGRGRSSGRAGRAEPAGESIPAAIAHPGRRHAGQSGPGMGRRKHRLSTAPGTAAPHHGASLGTGVARRQLCHRFLAHQLRAHRFRRSGSEESGHRKGRSTRGFSRPRAGGSFAAARALHVFRGRVGRRRLALDRICAPATEAADTPPRS